MTMSWDRQMSSVKPKRRDLGVVGLVNLVLASDVVNFSFFLFSKLSCKWWHLEKDQRNVPKQRPNCG